MMRWGVRACGTNNRHHQQGIQSTGPLSALSQVPTLDYEVARREDMARLPRTPRLHGEESMAQGISSLEATTLTRTRPPLTYPGFPFVSILAVTIHVIAGLTILLVNRLRFVTLHIRRVSLAFHYILQRSKERKLTVG